MNHHPLSTTFANPNPLCTRSLCLCFNRSTTSRSTYTCPSSLCRKSRRDQSKIEVPFRGKCTLIVGICWEIEPIAHPDRGILWIPHERSHDDESLSVKHFVREVGERLLGNPSGEERCFVPSWKSSSPFKSRLRVSKVRPGVLLGTLGRGSCSYHRFIEPDTSTLFGWLEQSGLQDYCRSSPVGSPNFLRLVLQGRFFILGGHFSRSQA